ncbi:amino acid ABC transporter substrate-binding protein (PAAT family) [Paenibacillus cellulosilyticus]|uniref:Amino acid ABC transporter substrate-binding protein (PAAT family) n=1 Tax=Paenibacillus cellulosilyticus TaxID=375489 RepID=A0A2V2Z367_9BACL|nr:transporter substrate-binding domain-containing protein [Paenibacillus cellulosilyticus]PWW03274.1 amino acid ABC transporter substrate-binding protein (PAAT family) [Paenibacillus cellulosilyticus]QKS43752.1 transporter substrate-binding domain-containing protein [Paenibacillus cellulosilyticus]
MKKWFAVVISVLLIGGLVACSSNKNDDTNTTSAEASGSLAAIKKADTIRLGIFADDAPFCYQDADGTFKGYDVELGKRIAKELLGDENKITWVVVNPTDRIPYLQTNKVDLMLADFTVTEDRAKSVDFTLPYEKVSLGIVSKDKAPITSVDDLKGKTLAVNTGTTADSYFTNNYPDVKLIKIDAITDGYQALITDRADAFAQDNTLLLSWAKKNPGYTVGIKELGNKDFIAGAVQQGNKELLDYVNGLIEGKLKDESFFHKLYDTTLKDSFPDDFTADQIVVEGGKTE